MDKGDKISLLKLFIKQFEEKKQEAVEKKLYNRIESIDEIIYDYEQQLSEAII